MTSGSGIGARTRARLSKMKIKKPTLPDNACGRFLQKKDNILVILMITSVVLGLILGFIIKLNVPQVSDRTIALVSFPGDLLMNMLKMLIIPLIVSSLISAIANLDLRSCGKIGMYALLYYVTTTLLAVVLGIILVVAIHPGNPSIKSALGEGTHESGRKPDTLDAFLDLFRNLFPENIVLACTHQQISVYVNKTFKPNTVKPTSSNESLEPVIKEVLSQKYIENTNVLGLVTFSVAFGICIAHMRERGKLMLDFFLVLNEIVMRLVGVIMWYAPFGILFLICGKVIAIDDLSEAAQSLGMYMVTVISGLAIHLLFTLTIIYYIVCRKNPLVFYRGMLQSYFTALGTGSSSATLPVTFKCLEENLGIDSRVTRFVLPIGATINMDGTALYEAVATIFIAQINEIELDIGKLVTISLTATLAAIGAATVPSAGLVTMVLVLTSVGLPINDITLILAVDWLLDRIRTSVNVMGDAFGAGVVERLCRNELTPLEDETPHGEFDDLDSKEFAEDGVHLELEPVKF